MAGIVLNVAWLVFAFIQLCNSEKHALNYYKLHELCGDTADDLKHVNVTSGMLELVNSVSRYKRKMDCKIRVKAPPDHQIFLKFATDNMAPDKSLLCIDYMLIHNKIYAKGGKAQDPPYRMNLCGDGPSNKTFVSLDRVMHLHVHVHSNTFTTYVRSNDNPKATHVHSHSNPLAKHGGYKLFMTSFIAGACQNGEFKCDNGDCMEDLVRCDDNASGYAGDEYPVLFLTVSGAVISLFFLFLIIACVCFWEQEEDEREKNGLWAVKGGFDSITTS